MMGYTPRLGNQRDSCEIDRLDSSRGAIARGAHDNDWTIARLITSLDDCL